MICKLCSAASHLKFNIKGYVHHLRLFHAHQADFRTVCGISGCPRSFTNFGTFINHIYSVHSGSSRADCEVISGNTGALDEGHENESCEHEFDSNHATEQDNDYESSYRQPTSELDNQPCQLSHEVLQRSSATFLLGMKEKFKLTQTSLQGIVQGVTTLNYQNMIILKTQVCTKKF